METYVMSNKELDQICIINRIIAGEISQKKGAQLLSLTSRHLRRKINRFKRYGELKAFAHTVSYTSYKKFQFDPV